MLNKKFINNKKIFFSLLILTFFCTNLFAIPNLNVDTSSEIWKNSWDLPVVEALIYFGGSLVAFMDLAKTFCIFFFFLNLMWHSFKLWFGTIEIKKIVIDIILKYVMVIALMNCYPMIVDGVFSLATNIGVSRTNSATYLTNNITATFTASYNTTITAMKVVKDALRKGDLRNVKPNDLKKLAQALALSPEELEAEFKKAYPNYKTTEVFDNIDDYLESVERRKKNGEWFIITKSLIEATKKTEERKQTYEKMFTETLKDYDLENLIILFDTFNSSFGMGDINQSTIASIMNGETSEEDIDAAIQIGESEVANRIKEYFTSPYLVIPTKDHYEVVNSVGEKHGLWVTEKNTFNTAILSPSQILNLGIMLAKVVENKSKIAVDKHQDKNGNQENLVSSSKILNFTSITLGDLFATIIKFIFPYLMLIPIVICIVQYIVCVLEYYLVTSVGIIFVPTLFFDPLKPYGSKLLQLFISYFMKVMMISIITYFTLGFLLKSGTYLMLELDTFGFRSVAYAIFTFVLSLVMCQGAPELGQILISGSPAMSAGQVARAGHSMAHAIRSGTNAAKKVSHDVGKAAQSTGKAVVGGVLAGKTLAQNRKAVSDKAASIYGTKENNWNGMGKDNATKSKEFQHEANASMFKEDIKQKIGSKFGYTQNKRDNNNNITVGGIGQTDKDGRKIGINDNRQYAADRAEEAHKAYVSKKDKAEGKA